MTPRSRPRGYTLSELVASATLVLAVGLGGLTAVQLDLRGRRVAADTNVALAVLAGMERMAAERVEPCSMVPKAARALQDPTPDTDACHAWAASSPGIQPFNRAGPLPDGLSYRVSVRHVANLPNVVELRLTILRDTHEVLSHALLVR